jgi:hypothetical protein
VPVVTFAVGDRRASVLEETAREIANLLQKRAVETKTREPYQLALKIRGRAETYSFSGGDLRLTRDEGELLWPIVDTLHTWRRDGLPLIDWLWEVLHDARLEDGTS